MTSLGRVYKHHCLNQASVNKLNKSTPRKMKTELKHNNQLITQRVRYVLVYTVHYKARSHIRTEHVSK